MAITRPQSDIAKKEESAPSGEKAATTQAAMTPPAFYQEMLKRPNVRELLARLAKGDD